MMLWVAGLTWRTWPPGWDYLTALWFAMWLVPPGALMLYALAQSAAVRRRYHEEWARLPIEQCSQKAWKWVPAEVIRVSLGHDQSAALNGFIASEPYCVEKSGGVCNAMQSICQNRRRGQIFG